MPHVRTPNGHAHRQTQDRSRACKRAAPNIARALIVQILEPGARQGAGRNRGGYGCRCGPPIWPPLRGVEQLPNALRKNRQNGLSDWLAGEMKTL